VKLRNLADVEAELNELAIAEATVARLNAEADVEIAKIRSTFSQEIGAAEEKVLAIRTRLTQFAEDNKQNVKFFPKGKKTLKVRSGEISISKGKTSVTFIDGADEAYAIQRIEKLGLEEDLDLLREPPKELDKNAVLSYAATGELDTKTLKRIGITVAQKETISVKPYTIEQELKLAA
jgi:phage host-nuclease inhibitor protein Gam